MSDDDLLARLRRGRGKRLATSTLGRLARTARVGLRVGSVSDGELDEQALSELMLQFGELKGIAMKMGQILSYVDDSLPEETRRALGQLQRWSPETPIETVRETMRSELGERAEALLADFEDEPVAAASVGQVHRARLPEHGQVAVKVRHPDIDRAMEADFRAALPSAVLGRLLAPGADIRALMEEARDGFLSECDYEREARMQQRFGELFAGHELLRIPAVHAEYCAPRVLVSEWVDGRRFEQVKGELALEQRNAIGAALYEFYVGSLYRHGVFNADPHPGNLLFPEGGGVVVLDHGCVREFDGATVRQLAALSAAVRADEREPIAAALTALGVRPPKKDADYRATRELLRSFYEPVLEPGAARIRAASPMATRSVVETKTRMLRLHVPGKLLFLFRIRFGLYAVLRALGAELDWNRLERELTEPLLTRK